MRPAQPQEAKPAPILLSRAVSHVASWFDLGRNMHLIVASAFAANMVRTAGGPNGSGAGRKPACMVILYASSGGMPPLALRILLESNGHCSAEPAHSLGDVAAYQSLK